MGKKLIRKQSAKLASKAIKRAQKTARRKLPDVRPDALLERLEETRQEIERDGRDAYANLKRLKNAKLPKGVETTVAMRLHGELPPLFRQLKSRGQSKAAFCSRFGLNDASESSKELSRLTIAPGASSEEVRDRRLRRHADKYRHLIDGICEITGQSRATLSDRVLMGTPLHPMEQVSTFSQTENVLAALQSIIARIDREFGLYEKFMEVSRLKAAHVTSGGPEHWPLMAPDPGCAALSEFLPEGGTLSQYRKEEALKLEHASEARFAFWPWESSESHMTWSDGTSEEWLGLKGLPEFLYMPHVRIGIVGWTCGPIPKEEQERNHKAWLASWRGPSGNPGETLWAQSATFEISWDPEKQCPVQRSRQPTPDPGDIAWLIIYPNRNHTQLVPMLYYIGEFPVLVPLDVRNLDALRKDHWIDQTRCTSVFDRLVELIGYRGGAKKVIEEDLRRTASWFDQNPFFKMKRAQELERNLEIEDLRAYLQELRGE